MLLPFGSRFGPILAVPCFVLALLFSQTVFGQTVEDASGCVGATCPHAVESRPVVTLSVFDPCGDLAPRIPYQAYQLDYYRRPYQASDVRRHSMDLHGEWDNPHHPYSSEPAQSIYRVIEQEALRDRLETARRSPTGVIQDTLSKDKPLEYCDWRQHRSARREWERERPALLPPANDR